MTLLELLALAVAAVPTVDVLARGERVQRNGLGDARTRVLHWICAVPAAGLLVAAGTDFGPLWGDPYWILVAFVFAGGAQMVLGAVDARLGVLDDADGMGVLTNSWAGNAFLAVSFVPTYFLTYGVPFVVFRSSLVLAGMFSVLFVTMRVAPRGLAASGLFALSGFVHFFAFAMLYIRDGGGLAQATLFLAAGRVALLGLVLLAVAIRRRRGLPVPDA